MNNYLVTNLEWNIYAHLALIPESNMNNEKIHTTTVSVCDQPYYLYHASKITYPNEVFQC